MTRGQDKLRRSRPLFREGVSVEDGDGPALDAVDRQRRDDGWKEFDRALLFYDRTLALEPLP